MAEDARGRVQAQGLVKRFGVGEAAITAIDGVALDIDGGSSLAVVGASGSGKSTLLNLLGGMATPDEGSIQVGDRTITSLGQRELTQYRREVGFVFQRFHLLAALTVLDNVIAPLLAVRAAGNRAARARAALELVGLAGRGKSMPNELSGGQQQRVAIARAIVVEPRIILADEPTGNLDSANGTAVIDLLRGLQDRLGTTLVIATHDPAVAAACQRTITMRDGRIVDAAAG